MSPTLIIIIGIVVLLIAFISMALRVEVEDNPALALISCLCVLLFAIGTFILACVLASILAYMRWVWLQVAEFVG